MKRTLILVIIVAALVIGTLAVFRTGKPQHRIIHRPNIEEGGGVIF